MDNNQDIHITDEDYRPDEVAAYSTDYAEQQIDQYEQSEFPVDTITSTLPDIVEPVNVHEPTVSKDSLRGMLKMAAAELLGTALFLFLACGSAMSTGLNYGLSKENSDFLANSCKAYTGPTPSLCDGSTGAGSKEMGISLSFGFSIAVLAYSIGHISGGHLNFAVTFGFFVIKKITWQLTLLYGLAQFCGGLIGIGFLQIVTPPEWSNTCFAMTTLGPGVDAGHGFVVECCMTFLLMFVVMAATDTSKSNQTLVPFAIGMAVFISHLVAIPLTGSSINPTRSFASAAAASSVSTCQNPFANMFLVYWIAPLTGSACAALSYELMFSNGGGLLEQYLNRAKF